MIAHPLDMPDSRSLWASLHDGLLERVRIEDGLVSLVVDVPHVRHHAKLPSEARFCVRAVGQPSLSVMRWCEPTAPRPMGHDEAAYTAWSALGTLRSIDWNAFAASLREPEAKLDIVEAEQAPSGDRVALTLGGNYRGPLAAYAWMLLRVEAASLTFAHEGGAEIPVDAFEALGQAYWDAWRASAAR